MSVLINPETCISCGICVPVCPHRAIAEVEVAGVSTWLVQPSLCTQCKGEPNFYEQEQCISICPVGGDCIAVDPEHVEEDPTLRRRGSDLASLRTSMNLPLNLAYVENSDLEPSSGEWGPGIGQFGPPLKEL